MKSAARINLCLSFVNPTTCLPEIPLLSPSIAPPNFSFFPQAKAIAQQTAQHPTFPKLVQHLRPNPPTTTIAVEVLAQHPSRSSPPPHPATSPHKTPGRSTMLTPKPRAFIFSKTPAPLSQAFSVPCNHNLILHRSIQNLGGKSAKSVLT